MCHYQDRQMSRGEGEEGEKKKKRKEQSEIYIIKIKNSEYMENFFFFFI